MAEGSDDELVATKPTVIEGRASDPEGDALVTSRSWTPTISGPMGIPRAASARQSPYAASASSYSKWAPSTYGPSSVSSSYTRHMASAPSSATQSAGLPGPTGPARSFRAKQKRDSISSGNRRSLLSSLLQNQQTASSLPMTPSRSRRQSTNSLASDSEYSPSVYASTPGGAGGFAGGTPGAGDWRPPFPTSAAFPEVSLLHVSTSTSDRVRYGPLAAPRSIMPRPKVDYNGNLGGIADPIDLVAFPVPDMLKMIASVLQHILAQNDQLYAPEARGNPLLVPPVRNEEGTQMRNTLLSFHGCIIPAISQRAYLNRILKYCPLTNEVFIALLIYFDRISHYAHQYTVQGAPVAPGTAPALFVLDSYNVHRLIIAGVTVASKFFSDIFYKNSRYAQVGGLPVDELNNLELQFLILLKFNLVISVEDFQAYAEYVQAFDAGVEDES